MGMGGLVCECGVLPKKKMKFASCFWNKIFGQERKKKVWGPFCSF